MLIRQNNAAASVFRLEFTGVKQKISGKNCLWFMCFQSCGSYAFHYTELPRKICETSNMRNKSSYTRPQMTKWYTSHKLHGILIEKMTKFHKTRANSTIRKKLLYLISICDFCIRNSHGKLIIVKEKDNKYAISTISVQQWDISDRNNCSVNTYAVFTWVVRIHYYVMASHLVW